MGWRVLMVWLALTGVAHAGSEWREALTGMVFGWVPGGCFAMGDGIGVGAADERPVHPVCVKGFWLGRHEVTQGQWQLLMGDNPARFPLGDNHPVETVTWDEVQTFIQRLGQRTGQRFRLPSEAEWEYACRSGGREERYAGGEALDEAAWYAANSGKRTHPVGQKRPNGLGLHDLSGNVWEWVADVYDPDAYRHHRRDNPVRGGEGPGHVSRGGSWYYESPSQRCSVRSWFRHDDRSYGVGFRLVRER